MGFHYVSTWHIKHEGNILQWCLRSREKKVFLKYSSLLDNLILQPLESFNLLKNCSISPISWADHMWTKTDLKKIKIQFQTKNFLLRTSSMEFCYWWIFRPFLWEGGCFAFPSFFGFLRDRFFRKETFQLIKFLFSISIQRRFLINQFDPFTSFLSISTHHTVCFSFSCHKDKRSNSRHF